MPEADGVVEAVGLTEAVRGALGVGGALSTPAALSAAEALLAAEAAGSTEGGLLSLLLADAGALALPVPLASELLVRLAGPVARAVGVAGEERHAVAVGEVVRVGTGERLALPEGVGRGVTEDEGEEERVARGEAEVEAEGSPDALRRGVAEAEGEESAEADASAVPLGAHTVAEGEAVRSGEPVGAAVTVTEALDGAEAEGVGVSAPPRETEAKGVPVAPCSEAVGAFSTVGVGRRVAAPVAAGMGVGVAGALAVAVAGAEAVGSAGVEEELAEGLSEGSSGECVGG